MKPVCHIGEPVVQQSRQSSPRICLTPRYHVIALVAVTSRILKINLQCALANDAYNLKHTAEWLFNEALIFTQKHLHKVYNV